MATHFEALAQPLLSSPHLQCVGEAARRTLANGKFRDATGQLIIGSDCSIRPNHSNVVDRPKLDLRE